MVRNVNPTLGHEKIRFSNRRRFEPSPSANGSMRRVDRERRMANHLLGRTAQCVDAG